MNIKRLLFVWISLVTNPAWAWNKHQLLMPFIFNGASELKQILDREVPSPCEGDDEKIFQLTANELVLNTLGHPPSILPPGGCTAHPTLSLQDILTSSSIDDPDQGFDKNLPLGLESLYDPLGDREWMGGLSGAGSQGFRHMYFGGWKFFHPVDTFQIPFRSLGMAPIRFDLMAQAGKKLIKQGNLAWGYRLITWSMHYLQDLAQPFHTTQIISFRMIPWSELWTWPFQAGVSSLTSQTVRVMTNYHWAYEGYIQYLIEKIDPSPLEDCLRNPEKYSQLKAVSQTEPLINLAYQMAQNSIRLSSQLGSAEFDFFGPLLKQRGVDFTQNPAMLDFEDYSLRPDLNNSRAKLHQSTCEALANASLASRWVLEWAQRN